MNRNTSLIISFLQCLIFIAFSFCAHSLIANPVTRITAETLTEAIEKIEERIIEQYEKSGREIPKSHRQFPYWKAKAKPLSHLSIDTFFLDLFHTLGAQESVLYIDENFLKTLVQLRPCLLEDLSYSTAFGRHVYNPNHSKRVYWRHYKLEHYFADLLYSELIEAKGLQIISSIYPPERIGDSTTQFKFSYDAPAWWKDTMALYLRAIEEERNYGEFFDELHLLLSKHKIQISAHLIRSKIAPAIGLRGAEKSLLLAAMVQSLMSTEENKVFICAGPLCQQNAGDLSPGKVARQLKDIGIQAQIRSVCHEGCRLGRHLPGDGFPKIDAAHLPSGMAPGARDILKRPGLFMPPGALCKTKLIALRATKI